MRTFSPPTWGWSVNSFKLSLPNSVLPTHVGMVRLSSTSPSAPACSPHPRGDGPAQILPTPCPTPFSPPTWGWSELSPTAANSSSVLPTHVGMVRAMSGLNRLICCSPHPRGDGPDCEDYDNLNGSFSPPTWGWSAAPRSPTTGITVLPTHVGMVRSILQPNPVISRSPHPRGDGPARGPAFTPAPQFSPPTWGWSATSGAISVCPSVLPTHVGMVRSSVSSFSTSASSPHPRGDGPALRAARHRNPWFSPPTWGWSGSGLVRVIWPLSLRRLIQPAPESSPPPHANLNLHPHCARWISPPLSLSPAPPRSPF